MVERLKRRDEGALQLVKKRAMMRPIGYATGNVALIPADFTPEQFESARRKIAHSSPPGISIGMIGANQEVFFITTKVVVRGKTSFLEAAYRVALVGAKWIEEAFGCAVDSDDLRVAMLRARG